MSYADTTTNICNQGLRLHYIFTTNSTQIVDFFPQRNFCKVQVQIKCSTSKLNFEHTNVLKYIKNVFISITFTCNPVSPQ